MPWFICGESMRWKAAFARSGTALEERWPERTNRALVTFAVVAVLVGTPFVSLMLFSEHRDTETIVVEPGSYHAMHFGFYGFGKLRYSCTGIDGPQIYLLDLDRINYERFAAGKPYEYLGYQTIGMGGSGYTMMAGLVWEVFLVLVNDEGAPATVEFKVDATAYFSLPAAALVLGAVLTVGYAIHRFSGRQKSIEVHLPSPQGALSERRKAAVAITGLIVISVAIVIVIGHALPAGMWFGFGFNTVFYRLWISVLACTAIAFLLRFRLRIVNGDPDIVLADLAHRLRVSRYRVSEKPRRLSVQISSTSAIKITAKPVSEGTLITYKADATPSGWTIIVILLLLFMIAPFSMAISLFMLYRSAVFADDRILPRLSQLPIPEPPRKEIDTRAMLIGSLSEGRRLSAEAYEAARSNYQDSILVLVTASLILSAVLAMYSGFYVLQDFGERTRLILSLLIGFIAGAASSLLSWRLLARKSRSRIDELRSWTGRLEAALSREIASESPPDGEPSSFELIAESYREIPKWLKIRRKAGMFREPGYWLLIILFSLNAFGSALRGAMDLSRNNLPSAAVFLVISATFSCLAAFIYLRWRKRQDTETESTIADVTRRFEALKAEMETYLRGV